MSKWQTSVPGAGRSPASRYMDEFKRAAVRLVSQEKYSFKAAATAVISVVQASTSCELADLAHRLTAKSPALDSCSAKRGCSLMLGPCMLHLHTADFASVCGRCSCSSLLHVSLLLGLFS